MLNKDSVNTYSFAQISINWKSEGHNEIQQQRDKGQNVGMVEQNAMCPTPVVIALKMSNWLC